VVTKTATEWRAKILINKCLMTFLDTKDILNWNSYVTLLVTSSIDA